MFSIEDNHGDVSDASVVQYPSDQKYYLQVGGQMLWKLGDISQSVNRIQVIPTQNIPQGFSIVGVEFNVIGAFLRGYNGGTYVVNEDGKLVCYYGNDDHGLILFALNKQGDKYYPTINEENPRIFSEFGFLPYGNTQSPTSNFEITVNNVTYNGVYNNNHFTITPDIVNEYQP